MKLSEFLEQNGDIELKKNARIKNHIWKDLKENLYPPSKTICENIIRYLGGESVSKQQIYRDALWKCILEIDKPSQQLEMKLHIEPRAAPRPRFTRFGRVYNPIKYTNWKKTLSNIVGDLGTISGGCWIKVDYYFCSPNAKLGYHTTQKDIDNIDKSLLDALQMNGLILDDKLVYRMDSTKYYGFKNMIHFVIHHSGIWTK